jgi:ribosome-associated protein
MSPYGAVQRFGRVGRLIPLVAPAPTVRRVSRISRGAVTWRRVQIGQDGLVSQSPIQDVPVAELPIRLGQFLKLAGVAEHGAHARELVETEQVQVNGQIEARRGAQLHRGDVVTVAGQRVRPVESSIA